MLASCCTCHYHDLSVFQESKSGNSLVVQWLGLQAFIAEGPSSIPGHETKIQKKKKKKSPSPWRENGFGQAWVSWPPPSFWRPSSRNIGPPWQAPPAAPQHPGPLSAFLTEPCAQHTSPPTGSALAHASGFTDGTEEEETFKGLCVSAHSSWAPDIRLRRDHPWQLLLPPGSWNDRLENRSEPHLAADPDPWVRN